MSILIKKAKSYENLKLSSNLPQSAHYKTKNFIIFKSLSPRVSQRQNFNGFFLFVEIAGKTFDAKNALLISCPPTFTSTPRVVLGSMAILNLIDRDFDYGN